VLYQPDMFMMKEMKREFL